MIEEEISALIKDLLAATAEADSEGILNATLALDSINKERGSEVNGHLKHYLDKRSYQKALAFIEG
jgi:hypothetical protein